MASDPLVKVSHLRLENRTGSVLVSDLNFEVSAGETLALVGESGSGKTLTLRSLLGRLPEGIRQCAGQIQVTGRTAMIFQDPQAALDPLCPVFRQLCEVLAVHNPISRREVWDKARLLLSRLQLPADLADHDKRPGQLSGGQCQRIVTALALACNPDVLLCDEPTTALDVTVQKQMLQLFSQLQQEDGFAMLFVTHNLAVASQIASRLLVMRAGEAVEEGRTADLLTNPQQAYTRQLLDSVLPVR